MAAQKRNTPELEIEVAGGGGLSINVFVVDGRCEARLQVGTELAGDGPCIGTGLSSKTCLRDTKTFLQAAINAIDENLEA